jgi:hypothetical protein
VEVVSPANVGATRIKGRMKLRDLEDIAAIETLLTAAFPGRLSADRFAVSDAESETRETDTPIPVQAFGITLKTRLDDARSVATTPLR